MCNVRTEQGVGNESVNTDGWLISPYISPPVHIHLNPSSGTDACGSAEQTRLAVGGWDGSQRTRRVYWEWGRVDPWTCKSGGCAARYGLGSVSPTMCFLIFLFCHLRSLIIYDGLIHFLMKNTCSTYITSVHLLVMQFSNHVAAA